MSSTSPSTHSQPLPQFNNQPRRNGSNSNSINHLPSSSSPSSNHHTFSPPSYHTTYRASSSSQSTRSSTTSTAVNPLTSSHMESTVTRLLVATKQLLESLTDWSHGRIDEGGVSDIYVRLGNEFNAASLAFSKEGIDMNDLNSVPEDLRNCLEAALSEDASPTTLDQHLPQIRQIVVHLLQGLKVKQAKWRAAKKFQENDSTHPSHSSISNRTSGRDLISPDRTSTNVQHPNLRSVPITRTLSGPKSREDLRRAAVGTSSTNPTPDFHRPGLPRSTSPGPHRSPNVESSHSNKSHDATHRKPTPDHHDPSSKSRASPVNRAVRTVAELSDRLRGTKGSPPPQTNHPTNHPPIPPIGYGIPIPPIPTSSTRSDQAAHASSLEALRKTDTLQRRASKRFSTYTYNKIAASPHRRNPGETNNPIGLGITAVPGLPLSPSQISRLIPRDENDSLRETSEAGRELVRRAKSSARSSTELANESDVLNLPAQEPTTQDLSHDSPDHPKNKSNVSAILEESNINHSHQLSTPGRITPTRTNVQLPMTSTPTNPNLRSHTPILLDDTMPTIFLQLGRDVKKVKLDSLPTIASLRVLFMDRFQYSPGLDDFPVIYIRDPQCGVQYQLEDMSEVKDRVVLSLNIDVLDQVKSHIDSGLTGLARELKELKSSITTLRRQSLSVAPVTSSSSFIGSDSHPNPTSSPINRPTDTQFKNVARHMLKRVHTEQTHSPESKSGEDPVTSNLGDRKGTISPTNTNLESPVQPNSAASFSELKLQQLTGTFKNQYNEVQNLRRELGILRQLYGSFSGETKEMISRLRSQAEEVKQVASTKISAPRTSINIGKLKLESRSQDLVTKIEALQDTVEDLKQDVTNRKMRPRPNTMISVQDSITSVTKDLNELSQQIDHLKPTWKKSWEEELQNIVDEQQLLNYQEDLVKDLKDDLSAVSSLFGHVKDYLDLRKSNKFKPKEFIPSISSSIVMDGGGLPEQALEGVLIQVKALEPKSELRLKAIEQAERKMKEKQIREGQENDEFGKELAGFVGGKKLKMTGGTDEIERIRQIRSEATIKAMVLGGNGSSGPINSGGDGGDPGVEEVDRGGVEGGKDGEGG